MSISIGKTAVTAFLFRFNYNILAVTQKSMKKSGKLNHIVSKVKMESVYHKVWYKHGAIYDNRTIQYCLHTGLKVKLVNTVGISSDILFWNSIM